MQTFPFIFLESRRFAAHTVPESHQISNKIQCLVNGCPFGFAIAGRMKNSPSILVTMGNLLRSIEKRRPHTSSIDCNEQKERFFDEYKAFDYVKLYGMVSPFY